MQKKNIIRVGPAGWHYTDWHGPFYPENAGKDFGELDYLCRFFDTAEVNSTFYRPANAFMAKAWLRKTADNPDFKFTAKLWQRFTHERTPYSAEDILLFMQGMEPLLAENKLGALLCQFPWSFKNSSDSRAWLEKIISDFRDCPLVFEVRHASWDVPDFYGFLNDRQAGCAAIDQPVIGASIPLKPIQTSSLGYVRLHGRNYQNWFKKDAPGKPADPSGRYDYLYSEKEISGIAGTVRTVASSAKETYVVQNNHPRGQALANAAQMRAALGEKMIRLPLSMLEHFPLLKEIASPPEDAV
ncbi:DUF72 domain-containing protein [bacterium]|nr:DUF72 domain-containing protein [bacterium]